MKKSKLSIGVLISVIIYALVGIAAGIVMGRYLAGNDYGFFVTYILLLVCVFAAVYVQMIIHESGHLLFGLLSGYEFSSFRIGSLVLIKQDGKLKKSRYSLAGTGGQCLMAPPEMKDGKMPYVLYNLGGIILNLISAAIFFALYLLCRRWMLTGILFASFALIGIALALVNGIPLRMGAVDNDGYNAVSMGKNRAALRGLWVQLKIADAQARGMRLKDMPDEWFALPDEEAMKNSMVAAVGACACSRLMDEHRFSEANELIKHYLEIDSGIVGVHRGGMICDRIFCELAVYKNREAAAALMDKAQQQFMKAMKNNPTVLRTEYVYALLSEGNVNKAQEIKAKFEKTAENYPYAGDIESERGLMELAEQ